MDEAVALLYQLQQTFVTIQFRAYQRRPLRIFQIFPTTVGEGHQILVIMVTSSGLHRIQLVEVQHVHHTLVQVLGHGSVVDDPQGITFLATLHPFGNLLQHTVAQVVVYFHLGILRELERIRLEMVIIQPAEYHREAEADDIVQIHQVIVAVLVGQTDKTSADRNRQFYQGVIAILPVVGMHLDGQVDVFIGLVGQLLHSRNPYGTDKPAQLLTEKRTDILLLLVVEFIFFQQTDVLGTQLPRHFADCLLVLFGIFVVQLVNLLDELPGMFALGPHAPVLAFGNATQGRHTYPEELIQIIGIDTQKAQSLQQRYLMLRCLLKNAAVKIHPTQIPLHIRF